MSRKEYQRKYYAEHKIECTRGNKSMTDIITVKNDLDRLSRSLQKTAIDYAKARYKLSQETVNYQLAYALAFTETDHSARVDDRKYQATLETQERYSDYLMAEAEVDSLKQTLRTLESVLNSTQTLASLLRDEMHMVYTN